MLDDLADQDRVGLARWLRCLLRQPRDRLRDQIADAIRLERPRDLEEDRDLRLVDLGAVPGAIRDDKRDRPTVVCVEELMSCGVGEQYGTADVAELVTDDE